MVWRSNKNDNWKITKFKNDTPTSKSNGKRKIVIENNEDKLFILTNTRGFIGQMEVEFPKDITVGYAEKNNYFTLKFS